MEYIGVISFGIAFEFIQRMVVGMPEVIDMCYRHKLLKWEFELDVDKWNSLDPDVKEIVSDGWLMVKYMNDEGTGLNKDIESLPEDKGGIYSFVLKPELIPGYHIYIMYIGRARRKKEFSLKKRCKTYLKDNRLEIERMRKLLGSQLYLRYLPLEDDDLIEKVESELIRVILPPCNSRYPDYNVLPEVPAF